MWVETKKDAKTNKRVATKRWYYWKLKLPLHHRTVVAKRWG